VYILRDARVNCSFCPLKKKTVDLKRSFEIGIPEVEIVPQWGSAFSSMGEGATEGIDEHYCHVAFCNGCYASLF
jgi:hypothetical protein